VLYISTRYPDSITPDPDEVYRINRIRVAQYLHCMPADVDAMPESDYQDLMEVMWAEEQIRQAANSS
jgi:hypothetical protein